MRMGRAEFERTVAEALDRLPSQFAELLSNVVVQTADEPGPELVADVGLDPDADTLFGSYSGVPLEDRGGFYGNVLPDVIFLFRGPLTRASTTREELLREIQLTLLHEIGHHFGLTDEEMEAWEHEFAGLGE
jgi:predicted Zn-dependent protease with MMP-like domain